MQIRVKRPVLINVLDSKSLLNCLVYLKFWTPQYMKIKDIIFIFSENSIYDQYCISQFQILEALNDQVS